MEPSFYEQSNRLLRCLPSVISIRLLSSHHFTNDTTARRFQLSSTSVSSAVWPPLDHQKRFMVSKKRNKRNVNHDCLVREWSPLVPVGSQRELPLLDRLAGVVLVEQVHRVRHSAPPALWGLDVVQGLRLPSIARVVPPTRTSKVTFPSFRWKTECGWSLGGVYLRQQNQWQGFQKLFVISLTSKNVNLRAATDFQIDSTNLAIVVGNKLGWFQWGFLSTCLFPAGNILANTRVDIPLFTTRVEMDCHTNNSPGLY